VGSSRAVVRVPDLSGQRLALSGVALGASLHPQASTDAADQAEVSFALRQFTPGADVRYVYAVYNAPNVTKDAPADLMTEVHLWQEERSVYDGPAVVQALGGAASKGLTFQGVLHLPPLEPGRYALQVVVTDTRPSTHKDRRTATQWVDFDVVAAGASADHVEAATSTGE
jgi:hypothetical protein